MKTLLALVLLCLTNFAHAGTYSQNPCPGTCVNQGGNPSFDNMCRYTGMGRGEKGCNQYRSLGCVWYPGQATITPAFCRNEGGNPSFDNMCKFTGMGRGKAGCDQYRNLGCVWHPETYVCR